MNKVKKIKNLFITSFALFFVFNYSYKLMKGNKKANQIIKKHYSSELPDENIVAHRGFSGLYEENSIESVLEALKSDCVDIIEIDIRFTNNHIFVLHHDSIINVENIKIKIEDINLEDIDDDIIIKKFPLYNIENIQYDDTFFLLNRFSKNLSFEEKLTRLSSILAIYNGTKPLILDVKTNEVNIEMIESLNSMINPYKDTIYIQSDYFPFLDYMIKLYPDYKYLYIIKSKSSLKFDNPNFAGYTVKYSLLNYINIKPDKLYMIYTINSNQKYLNLLDSKKYKSSMYIITDNPDYICALGENKKLRK